MSPSPDRNQTAREIPAQGEDNRKSPWLDNLALMYQGVLTGIVRLQATRVRRSDGVRVAGDDRDSLGDPDKFRQRMLTALRDIGRQAKTSGYSPEDIKDAEFATVAFLDEVVLSLGDSARGEWKRQTLAVELYGEARAGEVFFDRLDSLMKSRRDSPHVADVLEVYLLCLLLGFEGRYAGMRGELASAADRLRRRLDSIRHADMRLAPTISADPAPVTPEIVSGRRSYWIERWAFVVMLGVTALIFLVMKLDLIGTAQRVLTVARG